MATLTSDFIKKTANDSVVLSTIQICSIIAASKTDKSDFTRRILLNPEDTTWWKIISYYVVANFQDIEWEKLSLDRIKIEGQLIERCIEAIKKIGA